MEAWKSGSLPSMVSFVLLIVFCTPLATPVADYIPPFRLQLLSHERRSQTALLSLLLLVKTNRRSFLFLGKRAHCC